MQDLTFQPWHDASAARVAQAFEAARSSRGQLESYKYTKWDKVAVLLRPQIGESYIPTIAGASISDLSWRDERHHIESLLTLDMSTQPMLLAGFMQSERIRYVQVHDVAEIDLSRFADAAPMIIDVAPNAKVTCLQQACATQALYFRLHPGAYANHARDLSEHPQGWHGLAVDIAAEARFDLHSFSTGGQLQRQDTVLRCRGENATANVASAAWIGPSQHLDQSFVVQHLAPRTRSTHRCHNIARNKAKVTFNGRIYIERDCPGVEAELNNRNLALDELATFNTKPELEIYTDDVRCAHGATVGQLDTEQLFYFRSRGIDEVTARAHLAHAFLRQVVDGPLAEQVSQRLQDILS